MITSVHNPRIQAVRKLGAQSKERIKEQAFIIEGIRLSEEALSAGWEARQVFHTDQLDARGKKVVDEYTRRGASVEQVTEGVMHSISETETPQGLLVVLAIKVLPLPPNPDFLLILDGVRDPGNLGTILRTAAASGLQGVLLAPGNVDVWSPKVVRAGMGAHFRLPIQQMRWDDIRQTVKGKNSSLRVYLADSSNGAAYTRADFHSPTALIIGGEAAGAGTESMSLADEQVHIPMPGGSESLNVAVAASILLFEVLRQRGG